MIANKNKSNHANEAEREKARELTEEGDAEKIVKEEKE